MRTMKITWSCAPERGFCEHYLGFISVTKHSYNPYLIRFTVYPRPRGARRDQPAFKVKSILKGNEYERKPYFSTVRTSHPYEIILVSRQELIGWLLHQIAEQKRVDIATSGAPLFHEHAPNLPAVKDTAPSSDVRLLLPAGLKEQRKHVKQIFLDRG